MTIKNLSARLAIQIASLCLCFSLAAEITAATRDANNSYAVSTAHPIATRAAAAVLASGGNAFDAAVAASAVLWVAEPYSSGIGGGGFWLLYVAKTNSFAMVDGRERAPLAASANMYLDDNGKVIPGKSRNGPIAAGIPGAPAALVYLSAHYGSLQLAELLTPAINAAREGFAVDNIFRKRAKRRIATLRRYVASAATFLVNGNAPPLGHIVKQPRLAKTLEAIARNGRDGFYAGKVARELVADVRYSGGIWSLNDLRQYRVKEREPVIFNYRNSTIITTPLPSSGGIALHEIFNMLSILSPGGAPSEHLLVEVMRRAYRDRAIYAGDSDYFATPVAELRSLRHAKKLAASIDMTMASPSASMPMPTRKDEGTNTTHFSVADGFGNLVAATMSINTSFGSAYLSPATGVLLNNEMDDFSISPNTPNVYGLVGGEANAIAPGKRMLSSMTPSFVETEDRVAVIGTPGGSRIITMVLLGILKFLQGGDAEEIVSLKRFHHQYLPDYIHMEPGVFSLAAKENLKSMGHALKPFKHTWGNMHTIVIEKSSGLLEAAADPRGNGEALAANAGNR